MRDGNGYDATAKWLHWLVFVIVLAQFAVSIAMPPMRRGTVPGTLINLHFSLGMLILVVVALRWLRRLRRPVALSMPESPQWERLSAGVTHALLYALLLVGPVLGWAAASARDFPVTPFKLFSLPYLVPAGTRAGFAAGDVHAFLMWTLLALIGLHSAAALYHHYLRRDGVLRRMLPARGD
ncbi:MAG TPA: cytochrome b [Casimicrobiaceae bacterium]|nr:cytochrome b [Casimicrobiaceae bacterium]